jgi:hypothetical protein
MKIGLVGEAPNDTSAIKNLLSKVYTEDMGFKFFNMLDNITGDQLENQKLQNMLVLENQFKKPDIIIFIRDLDALKSDREKILNRRRYFVKQNNLVQRIGVALLNIFELEALIIHEAATFNSLYNVTLPSYPDATLLLEPKEILRSISNRYSESHNADIFTDINFDMLLSCNYFLEFIQSLNFKIEAFRKKTN